MNLLVLLITGLTLVGILAFHLFRRAREEARTGRKSGSQDHLARLSEETAVLGSSIDVFFELTGDYFISINSNGFPDLCKINESLKATIDFCKELEEDGDFKRRDELLRYVYVKRGKGFAPGFMFQRMDEDLINNLENWDERLAEVLTKITKGVRNSSSSFKDVGRQRASKRQNTTQLLNNLVGMVRR